MKRQLATCLLVGACAFGVSRTLAEPTEQEVRHRLQQAGIPDTAVSVGPDGQCAIGLTGTNVTDISFLKGIMATNLVLWETSVTNIDAVRGMPLTLLGLIEANVSDLSPLVGMKLSAFMFTIPRYTGHTNIVDLSPLKGMAIRSLMLPFRNVRDISPLTGMPIEGELDLSGSKVTDIAALRGMKLRKVNLRDTKVVDLSPLADMPLEELEIENTDVYDLSPISNMPLTRLNLYGTKVTDLSPVTKMHVTELWIPHGATDLTPLQGLALKTVYLPSPYRIVKGLDVLRSMPSLKVIGEEPGCATSSEIYWIRYDAKLKIFDAPHRHGTRKEIIEQWLKEDSGK